MRTEITLPYGREGKILRGALPDWEVLEPQASSGAEGTEEQTIEAAMEHPVGSPRLEELARGKRDAVIIISDHTRPVPSRLLLPPMLAALRRGNPDIQVTLLVATGCHRGTTEQELRQKLGEDIFQREKILVHDCDDKENMVCLGKLPSGTTLRVNRAAAETELLIAEGFIEPHFFAGYSGGRKSVLPGICARETVMANHSAGMIDHPMARAGILSGNPIHEDMVEAARRIRLAFILNVLLDSEKKIIHAVAGDPVLAHEEGCGIMGKIAGVHPRIPGDIVITSNGGAPLDQNVYQVVKSLSSAEAAAADGADLIVCAACEDGIGGEQFYRAMRDCDSPGNLLQSLHSVAPEETVPDQWQYQILCRILEKHRVLFVTDPRLRTAVAEMKMTYCPSLEEAVAMAKKAHPNGHVVVLPDGVSVIVK